MLGHLDLRKLYSKHHLKWSGNSIWSRGLAKEAPRSDRSLEQVSLWIGRTFFAYSELVPPKVARNDQPFKPAPGGAPTSMPRPIAPDSMPRCQRPNGEMTWMERPFHFGADPSDPAGRNRPDRPGDH